MTSPLALLSHAVFATPQHCTPPSCRCLLLNALCPASLLPAHLQSSPGDCTDGLLFAATLVDAAKLCEAFDNLLEALVTPPPPPPSPALGSLSAPIRSRCVSD